MISRVAVRGFTLIEFMITFAIAAILLLLAIPSFGIYLRDSEIRSTTESLSTGLQLARTEALRRNLPVRFSLVGGPPNASWMISLVRDDSIIQKYSKLEGAAHVEVVVTPVSAVSVTFNGLGRISPAAVGGNPNLQQIDVTSPSLAGTRPLRVYVDDAQGLRSCDPSPALAALTPKDPRAC